MALNNKPVKEVFFFDLSWGGIFTDGGGGGDDDVVVCTVGGCGGPSIVGDGEEGLVESCLVVVEVVILVPSALTLAEAETERNAVAALRDANWLDLPILLAILSMFVDEWSEIGRAHV